MVVSDRAGLGAKSMGVKGMPSSYLIDQGWNYALRRTFWQQANDRQSTGKAQAKHKQKTSKGCGEATACKRRGKV